MARRSTATDLAGLAGLATLGYYMLKDKKGTPTEALRPEAKVEPDYGEDYAREVARGERGPVAIGEMKPKSLRAEGPKGPASKPTEKPAAKTQAPVTKSEPALRRNVAGDYTRSKGATAEEVAAYRNREITPPPMTAEMRRQAEAQGLERVTPEEMLIGGPGLKTLHAAAKRLAAPKIAEYTQPLLSAPTPRLTGPSKAELLARDRAARAAARQEEMLKENARRYGLDPSAPGYEGAASALRRNLGGDEFVPMKKGGSTRKATPAKKAYAKGGAVKKESKPAAKGWGMARGGRPAKIY